mmetsp:Transcript_34931/g.96508  ORF Transcript_34931/g.96508 Transcript_34931/m.96508 type:complete len:221 (+) Transcript_34931:1316-1978(+)
MPRQALRSDLSAARWGSFSESVPSRLELLDLQANRAMLNSPNTTAKWQDTAVNPSGTTQTSGAAFLCGDSSQYKLRTAPCIASLMINTVAARHDSKSTTEQIACHILLVRRCSSRRVAESASSSPGTAATGAAPAASVPPLLPMPASAASCVAPSSTAPPSAVPPVLEALPASAGCAEGAEWAAAGGEKAARSGTDKRLRGSRVASSAIGATDEHWPPRP